MQLFPRAWRVRDRYNFNVAVPLLPVAVLFAAAAWLLHARTRRLQRASQDNLCPTCGYDLRASPDRCPECGAAVG